MEGVLSLPDEVDVIGTRYRITYCDNPADVDLYKRQSLWGQIDYWTRTIRVYHNGRPPQDVWQTLMHELIHAIVSSLHMSALKDNEDEVDLLALALVDVLVRNHWMHIE